MEMEKRILFEDDHLVAVKKNSGELVVADRWGKEKNILLHSLGEFLRAKGHQADSSGRDLYPVHRLDRETSGVVLFAKNEDSHRKLSIMFESRQMKKVYWALISGVPAWDKAVCSIPLTRAEGKKGRGRALIDLKKGKPSETRFLVKESFGDITWMEAEPFTGRLHQIRLHLKAMGHPILWDKNYCDESWVSTFIELEPQNLPLHARSISFEHPFTQKFLEIECPMEVQMRDLINRLKNRQEEISELH